MASSRWTLSLTALALAALVTGCTAGPPSTSPTTPHVTSSSTAGSPTTPSSTPSPDDHDDPPQDDPSQGDDPAVVRQLTGPGIDDLSIGEPGAVAVLEGWFGPPDSSQDNIPACGGGTRMTWGDLHVDIVDQAMRGWEVVGTQVPAGVQVPYGLWPGSTVAQVRAAAETSATTQFLPDYQLYSTREGELRWLSQTEDGPFSVVIGGTTAACG